MSRTMSNNSHSGGAPQNGAPGRASISQLESSSFFRFLRPSWIALLADRAIVTKAPRGSTITTEGSVSDALYMIVSGEITVSEGALGAGRDAGAKASANQ